MTFLEEMVGQLDAPAMARAVMEKWVAAVPVAALFRPEASGLPPEKVECAIGFDDAADLLPLPSLASFLTRQLSDALYRRMVLDFGHTAFVFQPDTANFTITARGCELVASMPYIVP